MHFLMVESQFKPSHIDWKVVAFCAMPTEAEALQRIKNDDPIWEHYPIKIIVSKPYKGKQFLRFHGQKVT